MEQEITQDAPRSDESKTPDAPRPHGDETPEKKTRVRPRSAKTQLQVALDDATQKGLTISEMKLIAARIETLSKMAEREQDAELKTVTAETLALKTQSDVDKAELATLRARVLELESNPQIRIAPDPDAAKFRAENTGLRERNEGLMTLLKSVVNKFETENLRAMAAIRAIKSSTPLVAKLFCECVNVDYQAYVQMSRMSDHELREVIARAKTRGPAVVYAEAALEVRDDETLEKMNFVPLVPEKRDLQRESEEVLRKLKTDTGIQPRPVRDDEPKTGAENLARQPREIVGSPDAMGFRERITPVSVNTLDARREEISGGGDFSPWV
jgi:hypothetical protein